MTLMKVAFCTLLAFDGFSAVGFGADQDEHGVVAMDALNTARQLASEGRLEDALHITHLVQRLPTLTDAESRNCRSLLSYCQSVAISLSGDAHGVDASLNRPRERARVSANDALVNDGSFEVDRATPIATGTAAPAWDGSGQGPPQLTPHVDAGADVPRLLSEIRERDLDLSQRHWALTLAHRECVHADNVYHRASDWLPPTITSILSAPAHWPGECEVDPVLKIAPKASVNDASASEPAKVRTGDIVLRWPGDFVPPNSICSWSLVTCGILVGICLRWSAQCGIQIAKRSHVRFGQISTATQQLCQQYSSAPLAREATDDRFSDICSQIADDNRRLR